MNNFKLRKAPRRITAGVLAVLMVLMVMSFAVSFPQPVQASANNDLTFSDLQTQINGTAAGGTLTLERNYTGQISDDNTNKAIEISKEITLDLNSHTIQRAAITVESMDGSTNPYITVNGTKIQSFNWNYPIIRVKSGGKLTITDSSTENAGTISGGLGSYGGGIVVRSAPACGAGGGRFP